jgi:hypothetical protein
MATTTRKAHTRTVGKNGYKNGVYKSAKKVHVKSTTVKKPKKK